MRFPLLTLLLLLAVPRVWDEAELATLELPPADAARAPRHITADEYYRLPVRTIYRSYPIYAPGREPAGYLESLRSREPEVIRDADGETVFDAPINYDFVLTDREVRNPAWYAATHVPLTRDGVMPFARYVIREKGKIEVGGQSCAMCHIRVMPGGRVIKGAQGNFPFSWSQAFTVRLRVPAAAIAPSVHALYAAPWVADAPQSRLATMTPAELARVLDAIPPGVVDRQGSSPLAPPAIPDLIGVADRRYLDHTGLVRHRSIGDLMRYSALNQGLDFTTRYGDFAADPDLSQADRYSDEQLHALAQYLYSLKPPPNPNRMNAQARKGQKVFDREGCAICHTPPLYTNNKLVPAPGFRVPRQRTDAVIPVSIGTDPGLTMQTRRGTGYYKVPSLKGVWYRGPFGHNGWFATLDDFFDPARLSPSYRPTAFHPYDKPAMAVPGHEFGLTLTAADRKALIAFLNTL